MLRAAVLLGLAGFAGCAPSVPKPVYNIHVTPDARGLDIAPLGQRIDFGRSPEGVIVALDRELGPHLVLTLAGCPAGVLQHLQWGALSLSFTDERFVGWRQGGADQGQVCAP